MKKSKKRHNSLEEFPSISFVIPTYNSERTLPKTLSSIVSQDYPKKRYEIILADGGSTDKTFQIAKKFGAKVISVTSEKQGPEYNRAVGAWEAKNEILAFLDHDNIIPHNKWLQKMTVPFLEDKNVVGVETLRYAYQKNDSLLGRYFSLLCVNDVLPFYLGKADRLSYMYSNPREYGVFKKASIQEKESYFIVRLQKHAIPTLGSNGFLVKRELLLQEAKSDPDNFFHIDVNVDLIRKGFQTYAFVKDTIVHQTDERGIIDYLRRRKLFVEKYFYQTSTNRRYSVYEKQDLENLILFIIYSLTFIKPTYDAMIGFIKVRDIAWFLHPVISFLMLVVYSVTILKGEFIRYVRQFTQK